MIRSDHGARFTACFQGEKRLLLVLGIRGASGDQPFAVGRTRRDDQAGSRPFLRNTA